jgi:hypothetical protein
VVAGAKQTVDGRPLVAPCTAAALPAHLCLRSHRGSRSRRSRCGWTCGQRKRNAMRASQIVSDTPGVPGFDKSGASACHGQGLLDMLLESLKIAATCLVGCDARTACCRFQPRARQHLEAGARAHRAPPGALTTRLCRKTWSLLSSNAPARPEPSVPRAAQRQLPWWWTARGLDVAETGKLTAEVVLRRCTGAGWVQQTFWGTRPPPNSVNKKCDGLHVSHARDDIEWRDSTPTLSHTRRNLGYASVGP